MVEPKGVSPNEKMGPVGNFDRDWYIARYPEYAEDGLEPLEHYLTKGRNEGKVPRALDDPEGIGFDEAWYCQRYSDLAEVDLPPLMHYLIYGRKEGRLKRPLDGPNTVARALRERFPEQEPLRVFAVPKLPRRITLVLDSVNDGIFGRSTTAIIFATLWAEHMQVPLRIVTRNEAARAASVQALLDAQGIDTTQSVEFAAYNDHENNSQLPVGPGELFVTDSWRNTASVSKVIPPEKIVYLLQEDERISNSSRDEYLRCTEVFSNKRLRFAVSSELLYDHLIQQGFEHLRSNGAFFEPTVTSNLFYKEYASQDASYSKRNFFLFRQSK